MADTASTPPLPPGFTLDQPQQAAAPPLPAGFTLDQQPASAPDASAPEAESPSMLKRAGGFYADYLSPATIVEPAANLASGMVSTPLAGLSGLVGSGLHAAGLQPETGATSSEQVQRELTYQPKTKGGQAAQRVVQYPFEKLEQLGDAAGDAVNHPGIIVPTPYGNMQGGPKMAAMVKTAIQFLPALLLRGRAKGSAAESETAGAPGAKIAERPPEVTAKEYVANRTNLDWDSLSDNFKATLTRVAQDATELGKLDPKAVERQARLESLPVKVPYTRGIITRDPVQLRNESNVAATDAGKPIMDIHEAANKALLDNLEELKKSQGGKTGSQEQTGASVQGAARAKAKQSKANYDALYKKARETEPNAEVSAAPLRNMLERNPEMQHLGFLQGWLKKADLTSPTKQASLLELQDLRTKASGIAQTGGTDGYYAGRVVSAIDEAMQSVPESAKAWKQANEAFKAHKREFSDQAGVARLVEDASRTDRAVALENTWQRTVKAGSIEDLKKVQKSLTTGEDIGARAAGEQAWRDLRAQTIQHIIDEATKSVGRTSKGEPNITPASMERAIKSIGDDKMEVLFGKGTVKQVHDIMEATRDVKTQPPSIHPGSSTMGNILALLEKGLKKAPVVGDTLLGVGKGIKQLRDIGKASREVNDAQGTPLSDAAMKAMKPKPEKTESVRGKIARELAAPSATAESQRK